MGPTCAVRPSELRLPGTRGALGWGRVEGRTRSPQGSGILTAGMETPSERAVAGLPDEGGGSGLGWAATFLVASVKSDLGRLTAVLQAFLGTLQWSRWKLWLSLEVPINSYNHENAPFRPRHHSRT